MRALFCSCSDSISANYSMHREYPVQQENARCSALSFTPVLDKNAFGRSAWRAVWCEPPGPPRGNGRDGTGFGDEVQSLGFKVDRKGVRRFLPPRLFSSFSIPA